MRHRLLVAASRGALAFTLASVAGAAMAQSTVEAAGSDGAEVAELVVLGQGETRQVQTVQGAELSLEAPGSSPLKLVEKLPNVNFQSADPFGAYEWSARITIRGFNQSQLGFTLDDVPLGDMTYGNHNGLHISRAIAGENVAQVELAQGAGALETASSNNLGGTLKFVSRDPSREFGGYASGTYGSESTWRGFARLETGELPTGTRAYLSYSYNIADKWKGVGEQKHQLVNFKAVQELPGGSLTGWLNWSQRRENDYQDLSLAMAERLGMDWDNISGDWPLAVQIAEIGNNRGDTGVPGRFGQFGTTYPAPIQTVDDAYFNASGLRDDLVGALTYETEAGGLFDFKATLYGHDDEGQGLWYTPYVPSPNYGLAGATNNDAPISIRTTEYDLFRWGMIARASMELGPHKLGVGFWYEDNDFNQARRFYGIDRAGPQPERDSLRMQRNPFFTQWEYDFITTTWQAHVQDTWTINDQLVVNLGFKALKVENEASTVVGANKTGTIEAQNDFLPQIGFRYTVSDGSEVFGGYARNMRAFPSSGTSGPFSASQTGFEAIRDELKPELSDTFELGWRYRAGGLQGLIAGYWVEFKDRLFGVPQGAGIIGNPSALSNVGGVTAKGIEAALDWRIDDRWSLFGSYAFNDSEYDDDTFDGDGNLVALTAGKTVVDTPRHLLKAELGYDDGAIFGRASVSHMSKRYFTYENDQSVPSQTVVDFVAGYRFSGGPWLDGLEAQVNVTNVFGEEYFSTINSNGFPLRGDSQTLLPGAPRQVFVSLRKRF